MADRIEDYGLIGDLQTAALVGRSGSIDWLCFPRFDSGACFAALLGSEEHGRWLVRPAAEAASVERRYRPETLVLETEFRTDEGAVRLVDFMPPRGTEPDVVRIVEGLEGRVPMRTELTIRFDYGSIVPWVRRIDGTLLAVAGPDALLLRTPIELYGENFATVGDFVVAAGDRVPFVLTWFPSSGSEPPAPIDAFRSLDETCAYWREWSAACTYRGRYRDAVLTSLLVLKALTYAPTGGIVAAPTTSLPEMIGGVRNWDYRFCWLRDATFTLIALLQAGYTAEAEAWRDWLLRAVAGRPADLQIMYGPAGERRLVELVLDWLPGYAGSSPVRIGNDATRQAQLDVYGEVLDTFHQARRHGVPPEQHAWSVQLRLLEYLESAWRQPDQGIWEVRGPPRHFTHSKVMCWVALDRAIRAVDDFGLQGPDDRWRRLRREIQEEVLDRGYDAELGSFVQFYGSKRLDASLLTIPLVGFLPPDDPRVQATLAAVRRELERDGLLMRYAHDDGASEVDGLPAGEGAFLLCTFWLADDLALAGRYDEARAVFESLLALRNDLGLLSEQYDPHERRMLGNFPQAFSHIGLVTTALNLARADEEHGPAHRRGE